MNDNVTLKGARWWKEVGWKHVLAVILMLYCIFPLLYVLSASLNPGGTISGSSELFRKVSAENYATLFGTNFPRWMLQSFVVSTATAIGTVLMAASAAYAFSRYRFTGRRGGLTALMLVQMFPQMLAFVAIFLLLLMVNAVFGVVIAQMMIKTPSSVLPVWGALVVAFIIGQCIYRYKMNLFWVSLIGVVALYLLIYLGPVFPLRLPEDMMGLPTNAWWIILLFVYAAVALLPFRVIKAVMNTRKILKRVHADAVIGFGGYVSAPAYLAARSLGIPFFVHEANARAGMANKLGVFLGGIGLNAVSNSGMKGDVVGVPIRASLAPDAPQEKRKAEACDLWGLDPNKPTVPGTAIASAQGLAATRTTRARVIQVSGSPSRDPSTPTRTARTITPGTSGRAIRSAIRARSPFSAWACSTSSTIVVSELSVPAAVASTSSTPALLIAPADTASPGATSTGIDSPVIAEVSRLDRPERTSPSVATRSPGRTSSTSPTAISLAGTEAEVPSRSTGAAMPSSCPRIAASRWAGRMSGLPFAEACCSAVCNASWVFVVGLNELIIVLFCRIPVYQFSLF